MSDKPEDRPEERRRTGPLGDDAESDETRREPQGGTDAEPTRQVQAQRSGQSEESPSRETERVPQRPAGETEDKETRVIRTPPGYGTAQDDASPYPRGYFEAAKEREDRLRDMYGGVDWLASFLGYIFAVVVGSLLAVIAGLVLAPLGFSVNLEGQIGAGIITGLVLVGVLIFLTYFFGGYVAGRLARFDGGRNGAMLLLWTLAVALLAALAGGIFSNFLPTGISDGMRSLIQNQVLTTIGNLTQLGIGGILVAIGALLVALLGGFLGGRLGSRYHAEIDRTT